MVSIGAVAQSTEVTIGSLEGAANNSYLPMNSLYNYSYTQQIYTADEIGIAGTINSITMWMYGNANLYEMPLDIYMLEVDKNAFSSTTDWVAVTSANIVYSGSVTVHNTDAEAYTFTLTTPFEYSGAGNLVICVNNTTGNWKSGLNGKVFGASSDPSRAIYARQDSGAYDPENPATATSTTYYRNVVMFDITPAPGQCLKPTELAYSEVAARGAHLAWTNGGTETAWQICLNGDEDNLITATTNPYDLTGLTPETAYAVKVRAVCGENDNSRWSNTVNFTTLPSCPAPTTLVYADVTINSVVLSWTNGAGETAWQICINNNESELVDVDANPYTLNDLTPETAYSVKVRANCGVDDGNSQWTSAVNFTTLPACPAPTALVFSNITNNYVSMTWTPGESETHWNFQYKKSSVAEWGDDVVALTDPSCYISGLDAGTTYNVRIQADCESEGTSGTWLTGSFTTAYGIPFVEEFATTSMPANWMQRQGLLSDVMGGTALTNGTAWYFGSSNGVFDSHARINIYGDSRKYWLITPTIVMDANVQLTFDLALTAYSGTGAASGTCDDDKFVVLISTDNGETWTILRQYDNAGSEDVYNDIPTAGVEVSIDLRSYATDNVLIAFYGESTVGSNGDNNLHIDNVRLDYIRSCTKPTTLAVSNVLARTANLTWVAGSDETAWQICLNDDEDNLIDVEGEPSYTLTNLTPVTPYTVKVRANCGGEVSAWSTSATFTTTVSCPAPTSLNANLTPGDGTVATLSWAENGAATTWTLEYGTAADFTGATPVTVEDAPTANLTDLTPETTYYARVKTVCGDDDESAWSNVINFTPTDSYLITLNDGTTTNSYVPVYGYYVDNYSRSQFIIPASELTALQWGTINKLTFYSSNNSINWGVAQFDVRLKEVDYTTIDALEDWDGMSLAYHGSLGISGNVMEITFDTPYTYMGGNLMIGTNETTSGSWSSCYWYGVTADGASLGGYGSSSIYQQDFLPKVTIEYTPGEIPTCFVPTALAVSNITMTGATLSWTAGADETAWQICVNDNEENLIDVTGDPTYTFTELTFGTVYTIKVRSNCGEDDLSSWTAPITFTTDFCAVEDMCRISYELSDLGSYGSGWYGAAIKVVDAETGVTLATWALGEGEYSTTGTLSVCNGRNLTFEWVAGQFDSYVAEYAVYDVNDDEIFSGEGAMQSNVNYTVNCSRCKKPATVEVINVTSTTAELTWTAGATEEAWQICLNGDEENIIDVTETTYPIANLVEETGYTVKVRANCGEEQSGWVEVSFTTPSSCPDPENYVVNEVTNVTANISWDATADGYVVRYAPANILLYEDFEEGMPEGWTTVDVDGDGFNWTMATDVMVAGYGHNGSADCLLSQSYASSYGALTPNNWIITPAIELPSDASVIDLQFYAVAQDASYPDEHYAVYVSTTTTDPSDFTLLWEETMDANGGAHRAQGVWGEKNTNLTAYAGQTVYIALRHFGTTDMFYLNVDDFAVYAVMPDEWTVENTTETSIELTGLNANTTYLYQLNGVCGSEPNNSWTCSTFTTDPNTYTITATAGENGTINPADETVVVEGDDLDITIQAATGYRIENVIVDAETENEVNVTAQLVDGVYTFENIMADHTIHATFVAVPEGEYVITVNAVENGTITPNGIQTVAEGNDFVFTVNPDDCYGVTEVTVNDVEVTLDENNQYTIENVTENKLINVIIEMLTYTITATATENGTISPASAVVNCGNDQAITITPAEGYRIESVVVDAETENEDDVTEEELVAGDGVFFYTFENVTANHTINVTFEEIPTYTITVDAGENGTVLYNDALVSEPITVNEGATPEFVITPATGYQIETLTVGGETVELTAEQLGGYTYTFEPVMADVTLVVTFEAIPVTTYTITLTVGEHGTVTYNGEEVEGEVTVEEGATPAFVITPAENYQIDVLTVGGVTVAVADANLLGFTYIFEAVTANTSLSVTFVEVGSAEMLEAGSMAIYPNPNNGMFSIDFSNIEGDATYQLIDARGAVVETRDINVMSGETMNINHNLRPGAYFVRIINGDKVYVEQIVVE